MFSPKLGYIAGLIGLGVSFVGGLQAQPLNKLDLDNGVSVGYPATWSVLPKRFRNTTELIVTAGRTDTAAPVARAVLTSERHKDSAAAVRGLAGIAAEVAAPVRYRVIGGWPALERRYASPRGERGQRASAARASGAKEELALRVTTAIAADDVLVRLETTLLGSAKSAHGRELQRRTADQAITLGRGVVSPKQGIVAEAQKEVARLRSIPRASSAPTPVPPQAQARDAPGTLATLRTTSAAATRLKFGELEIAASQDGQRVVIAGATGYAVSHDFGRTFTRAPIPIPFRHRGDPSVTVGKSGAFYVSYVGLPSGTAAGGGFSGCTTAVSKSTENGTNFEFKFLGHAVRCPLTGADLCFPDQAHLAADRNNAGLLGADQIYAVYRNCLGERGPGPRTCEEAPTLCRGQPSIVCSADGGLNWTTPEHIETAGDADFPRVAVAKDGVVYVVFRKGDELMLAKYTSCASGLMKLGTTIAIPTGARRCSAAELIDKCHCPIPGLDRCNNGNLLSSPTIAVDDTDPSRVYVAFSRNTSPGNEDVIVKASTDGGTTWLFEAKVSEASVARRFMPWVCTLGGRAYVTWYDRRKAAAADNSLTEYYLGSAGFEGGILREGPEVNLSGNPDSQCSGEWPDPPRETRDSESCSLPQKAGICSQSGKHCSYSRPNCRPPQRCELGDGKPKYGDYNGNVCAGGMIFTAWASATPPQGLPPEPSPSIRIYSSTVHAQSQP